MYYNSEIKKIAINSENCCNVSLSHFSTNDKEIYMSHNHMDQLTFIFFNSNKDNFYNELEIVGDELKIILKENKQLAISYNYPYFETTTPDKWVSETCGIFKTGDYFFVPGNKNKEPNYDKVGEIIYKALNKINNLAN